MSDTWNVIPATIPHRVCAGFSLQTGRTYCRVHITDNENGASQDREKPIRDAQSRGSEGTKARFRQPNGHRAMGQPANY